VRVEPVKIFLSSSLITTQNLVAVCRTLLAHVGCAKKSGLLESHSLGIAIVPDPVKTRPSLTYAGIPNLVGLGQTVWTQLGGIEKIWATLSP